MARRSQVKGRRGERELAALLQQHGYNVRPGEPLNFGMEPDLVGLPEIHIECKRCEQLRLTEWLAQAVRDSEKFNDGTPVLFHRRNRQEWLCTMRLSDWLRLYEMAHNCKCGGRCPEAETAKILDKE